MGLIDAKLQFSSAQAITSAADSTNYVDLDVARDIAVGTPLYLMLNVTTAFTDGSSDSTLTVTAEFDSTTTFTPDYSYVVATLPALSAAGTVVYIPLHAIPGATKYRYMQVSYAPNSGDLTTGSVSAQIVMGVPDNYSYPNAYTIT